MRATKSEAGFTLIDVLFTLAVIGTLSTIAMLGFAGTALAAFFGLFALPSLITGYGLLHYKPWSRIVGIVLSAISLIFVPVGTIIGAYGLWVLLSKNTEQLFNTGPITTSTPL